MPALVLDPCIAFPGLMKHATSNHRLQQCIMEGKQSLSDWFSGRYANNGQSGLHPPPPECTEDADDMDDVLIMIRLAKRVPLTS